MQYLQADLHQRLTRQTTREAVSRLLDIQFFPFQIRIRTSARCLHLCINRTQLKPRRSKGPRPRPAMWAPFCILLFLPINGSMGSIWFNDFNGRVCKSMELASFGRVQMRWSLDPPAHTESRFPPRHDVDVVSRCLLGRTIWKAGLKWIWTNERTAKRITFSLTGPFFCVPADLFFWGAGTSSCSALHCNHHILSSVIPKPPPKGPQTFLLTILNSTSICLPKHSFRLGCGIAWLSF